MVVSTKTRYGMRFLAELSLSYGVKTLSLKEVARRQELSLKYLSQIVIPLKNAGLITSVRGSGGGYSLAKEPGEISLKTIVEILEGGLELIDCIERDDACGRAGACPTQWVWNGLSRAMSSYLEELTLGDVKNRMKENEVIEYFI